ncbi:MAG: VCBS repeat-containing protein [Thermoguttaceae bacterium]|nr:VCBS repeat-containing protein [Thermoguttaceae bacterium]
MRRFAFSAVICFTIALLPCFAQDEAKPEMTIMHYNHPGLLDDLAVGLWSWPVPADFNHDGRPDLIVSSECVPYNGVFRFESLPVSPEFPGQGTPPESSAPVPNPAMPVFKPAGKPVSRADRNLVPSWVNGELRVITREKQYPDFTETGMGRPEPVPGLGELPPDGRANMWKYVDFNADGATDLAVGVDDWTKYGWDNAYSAEGVWQNPKAAGNVYLLINRGTDNEPRYDKPVLLETLDGRPIDTYAWPSPNFFDFDGDGDLDLLCGEFIERFTYFENVGSAEKPVYAPGVPVLFEDGTNACENLCMPTPVLYDWTGNGYPDIIAGNEDGRVSFFENTGKFTKMTAGEGASAVPVSVPLFKRPLYFQQEADELKASSLTTPCCVDFDGDGAVDIVTGTTEGTILFFKNLSPPGEEFPKWARPVYLKARGKSGDEVFRITAGTNGSIQGPIERKYGYTAISVTDWDADGFPDILVNSIFGKVVWLRNIGSAAQPAFDTPRRIEVEWEGEQPRLAWGWMTPGNDTLPICRPPEHFPARPGKALLTQWRTTPLAYDWTGDGLPDLSMLDTEGYLVLFERYRDEDGELKLKAPRRAFKDSNGTPYRLNANKGGASGRRKICVTDWDGDGLPDLLVNTRNAALLRCVKAENGDWYFQDMGDLSSTLLAGHSTSPTTADFNADGVPDLVIGAEDGRFYYLKNQTRP